MTKGRAKAGFNKPTASSPPTTLARRVFPAFFFGITSTIASSLAGYHAPARKQSVYYSLAVVASETQYPF
jgi:hypothetical protein